LLLNDALNYKLLHGNGNFSSVWVNGNTKFSLAKMTPSIKYKTILIDATNRDYKIKILEKTAENNHTEVHILKKNKAYLVQLTQ
jgi:competence protein ComEC